MKQYQAMLFDETGKRGVHSDVVLATDCEKAIAKAYEEGYEQGYICGESDLDAGSIKYAGRVMENNMQENNMQWKLFDEEKPTESMLILAINATEFVNDVSWTAVGHYRNGDVWVGSYKWSYIMDGFTHWIEIPQPDGYHL